MKKTLVKPTRPVLKMVTLYDNENASDSDLENENTSDTDYLQLNVFDGTCDCGGGSGASGS